MKVPGVATDCAQLKALGDTLGVCCVRKIRAVCLWCFVLLDLRLADEFMYSLCSYIFIIVIVFAAFIISFGRSFVCLVGWLEYLVLYLWAYVYLTDDRWSVSINYRCTARRHTPHISE